MQRPFPLPALRDATTGDRTTMNTRTRRQTPIDPRAALIHGFIILLEIGLLAVQGFRAEEAAFDMLPGLADIDLGIMYGSHLLGVLWVMIVIFVSYTAWDGAIRLHTRGADASGALKLGTAFVWLVNLAAMVFEFVLFRMLVDDFNAVGVTGAAELFGVLMVAAHQVACFWIMRNVIRQFFFLDDPKES